MPEPRDPFSLDLDSELAEQTAIDHMEGLATELLSTVPVEIHRQYGYNGDDGGVVYFSTHVHQEQADLGSIAAITLAESAQHHPLFSLRFWYDDRPDYHFDGVPEEVGPVVLDIIQDLLETGSVQKPDAALLRHVRALISCLVGDIQPEDVGLIPPTNGPQEHVRVADVVRNQVEQNTTFTLQIKNWERHIDDEWHEVQTQEVLGDASPDDDVFEQPSLQICYVDNAHVLAYSYLKYPNGDISLDVSNLLEPVTVPVDDGGESLADDETQFEIAVLEEMYRLGHPKKHGVDVLIRQLSGAVKAAQESSLPLDFRLPDNF